MALSKSLMTHIQPRDRKTVQQNKQRDKHLAKTDNPHCSGRSNSPTLGVQLIFRKLTRFNIGLSSMETDAGADPGGGAPGARAPP